MDVYDRIHSRQSVTEIVRHVSESGIKLNSDEFLKEIDIVLKRNQSYAKQLLKAFIDHFEHERDTECVEPLYEPYIALLHVGAADPEASDVVQYKFDDNKVIIEEIPTVICAEGTTGFRTWEAALFMCHYMATDSEIFSGQCGRMLELGCGTGIVSILYKLMLDRTSRDTQVIVTDGDSNLLQQVKSNFALNGLDTSEAQSGVRLQRLRWNEDDVERVDLILAADVTYDTSVLPDLVQCIKQTKAPRSYVACTERNMDTLVAFEHELRHRGFQFEVVTSVSPSDFKRIFERIITTSIRLYKITM